MKVLAHRSENGRSVRVVEYRFDGSRLYFEGPSLYTHVDANGTNQLDYIAAMGQAMAGKPSVLLLGTAGGALATQLSRAGASVTAVDDCSAGCCQSNANSSPLGRSSPKPELALPNDLPPLSQGG